MQAVSIFCFSLFIATVFGCCSTIGDMSITCNGTCSYTYVNNKCLCLDDSPCQICPTTSKQQASKFYFSTVGQKGLEQNNNIMIYSTYPEPLSGVFTVYLFVEMTWGYDLSVIGGFAQGDNSTDTCVTAIVTNMLNVQTCSTNYQMWVTWNVNVTYPVIPTALVSCDKGKGFPWQLTCDWTVNWYINPNVVLFNNGCSPPPTFLQTLGC